jgi:putative nucleotidyltransferase with HDIG domain
LGEFQVVAHVEIGRFLTVKTHATGLYALSLILVGSSLGAVLWALGYGFADPWVLGALALVSAIAERGRVQLPSGVDVSIALLPNLFVAVFFGPLPAAAVGALSFLGHLRSPYLKWVVFTSGRAITWALTGIAASAVGATAGGPVGAIVVGAAVGALLSQFLDTANTAVIYKLRGKGPMREVVASLAPLAFASVPFFAPVVVLLGLAYSRLSPWTLALFFVPALGAQRLFVLYQEQRQLTDDFGRVNEQLERANLSFATALVQALDERDRYTAGHSAAVAVYARDIAARMGLSDQKQQLAHLCGLVHDIGKVGLPPGLLDKPGALTLEERRQMQEHSAIGERILRKVEDYAEIAHIVRHHHERWDGQGYPDGVAREDVPLLSRVIAVADAYNAMTSDRPYRDAMPSRVARMRLAQAVESQFDTTVVAAFEAVLAGSTEEYRTGKRADFSLVAQDRWSSEVDMRAA